MNRPRCIGSRNEVIVPVVACPCEFGPPEMRKTVFDKQARLIQGEGADASFSTADAGFRDGRFIALSNQTWQALGLSGRDGIRHLPRPSRPAGLKAGGMPRNRVASGHAVAKAMRTRDAVSPMRAARQSHSCRCR